MSETDSKFWDYIKVEQASNDPRLRGVVKHIMFGEEDPMLTDEMFDHKTVADMLVADYGLREDQILPVFDACEASIEREING